MLKSRGFWRLIAVDTLILLATLVVLGIAFMLIVQGILMALVRLAPVWPPAGRLIDGATHNPEGTPLFPTPITSTWGRILIAWPAVLWLGMSAIGVWILARDGFLPQNLIYQLFIR
jgi:hypothetical protein